MVSKIWYWKRRPFGKRGVALRWVIIIHEEHKEDLGLLRHERDHILLQKEVGIIKYLWKYFIEYEFGNESFRAYAEARAFMKGSGYSKEVTANILRDNYGISHYHAKRAIAEVEGVV